ncbi:fibronectin type III domain-containing protein [Nonomuraea guangzhouensis]|uniref:Fibronectin type III domain-containing protein n=1 Tax=Nonomuraea guangzhouensis TaxID=1291555 RepID=A0ABW4GXX7_9ACTN|nr:fibronectin type III domain-containing protein [Nonomuraea guangzhouensis]
MPVNEVVMGLGSWSLTLVEETPRDVLDRLQFFGHVAFIPGRLNPAEYGDQLLTMARYVGVLTGRDFDLAKKIDGQSTAVWLGDADDKGEVIESPISINNTFPNAIRAILGAGTAVVEGTLYSVPGTYKSTHVWQSKRKAINYICNTMNAEWRVTGDCKLDAGLISDLYVTNPTCVIVRERPNRHTDGADLSYRGLRGDMALATDVDDYTTRVVVIAEGEGQSTAIGSADNPSVLYSDIRGNLIKRVRLISESGTTSGNANGRAQVQLNRYLSTRNALRLTTDDYDVRGAYKVGDYVWIYDPDAGLLDTNNEIMWRGERINPIKLRIAGSNWPVREGTTVAYRHQDGTWIDLTQFVDFEGGETTVDVGELLKSLSQGGLEPVGDRPIPDSTIPGAVTWDLPFLSGVYLDGLGNTRARMQVSWDLPLNVDGSTILDGDHYEIQSGVSPATEWQTTFAPWGDLTAMVLDLSPGVDYDFRIRAVDSSNNQGAWSAVETATANPDTIPPSTPAAPTVAASLIAIQITHTLGKASGGTYNLELDLDHLEVHVGATSGFTPDSTTLRGQVAANAGMMQAGIAAVGTVPESNTSLRQVKVIAVDQAGNRSSASAAASVTALLIDDAHITDLTVSKVTAGTISANWLIGASIRTASSGQRVELNTTGLHGFNSGGTELVTLSNSGSFTLRSATSGARIELDNAGFRAYNSSSQQTVDIASSTGNVTIVGQLSSAFSGRRIIFNPSGTTDPEIRFLSSTGTIATSSRIIMQGGASPGSYAWFKMEGPTGAASNAHLHLSPGDAVGFTELGETDDADYFQNQVIGMGNSYTDRRIWFGGRIKPANDSGVGFAHSAVIPGSVDVDGSSFTIFDGYYGSDPMYAMFTPTAGNPVGHAVTNNGAFDFSGHVSVALSGSDRITYWNIRL